MTQQSFPSNEWEISKIGRFSASKIDDLLTEPTAKEAQARGELSVTAKKYIKSKVAEIITGTVRGVTGYAIEHGNTYEPVAAELLKRIYPEMEYQGKLNPIFYSYSDFSGGSPDGVDLVNKLIFEIKCPEDPSNHVEYCLMQSGADLKKVERDYYHQIQFNMLCVAVNYGFEFTEMKGVFASYSPIVQEPYTDLKVMVIHPDMEFLERIKPVIERAEIQLAKTLQAMRKKPSVFLASHDPKLSTTLIEGA